MEENKLETYKQCMINETNELFERICKLENVIKFYDDKNTLGFSPDTPKTLLLAQYSNMVGYLAILIQRSYIEDVPISEEILEYLTLGL